MDQNPDVNCDRNVTNTSKPSDLNSPTRKISLHFNYIYMILAFYTFFYESLILLFLDGILLKKIVGQLKEQLSLFYSINKWNEPSEVIFQTQMI